MSLCRCIFCFRGEHLDDYPHCNCCCFWRICILQVQNPGMIAASFDVSAFGFLLFILSLVD